MAEKTAPLFKKSMHGYNKEDVNNYILKLNNALKDKDAYYEKVIDDYKEKAENDRLDILDLEEILKKQELLINDLYGKLSETETNNAEIVEKDNEIISLRVTISELEEKLEKCESQNEGEKEKAEYYDSICSKAGEILFIASGTAETILNRANDEAQRIVGSANSQKDLVLRTLSDSVDAAADDINAYIKAAVEECIKKIDASVKEATEMTGVSPKSNKPRTVFINEK